VPGKCEQACPRGRVWLLMGITVVIVIEPAAQGPDSVAADPLEA